MSIWMGDIDQYFTQVGKIVGYVKCPESIFGQVSIVLQDLV